MTRRLEAALDGRFEAFAVAVARRARTEWNLLRRELGIARRELPEKVMPAWRPVAGGEIELVFWTTEGSRWERRAGSVVCWSPTPDGVRLRVWRDGTLSHDVAAVGRSEDLNRWEVSDA